MGTSTLESLVAAADGAFNMRGPLFLPLVTAVVVTCVATPVVRRVAIALDLFDRPDAGLKPHEAPIPYLGGVAIYLGWLAAVVCAAVMIDDASRTLLAIAVAGTILMLTGMVDDIRHLRPRTRLALQAVAAGVLLFGGVGRRIALTFAEPFLDISPAALDGHPVTLAFSGMITVAILLSATNATNLIDGLDGLCAGVTAVAAVGYVVLGLAAIRIVQGPGANAGHLILAAALLGACLGFLVFNFNPASIFMGDSGSLLLGLNAAVLMILFAEQMIGVAEQSAIAWFAAGVMVFAFPVFDTGLAVIRRRINRKPLFIGDRSHFYDQLRDRGLPVRRTVLLCYGLGVGFSVLGAAVVYLRTAALLTVYAVVVVGAAWALRQTGMLRVDDAAAQSAGKARDERPSLDD